MKKTICILALIMMVLSLTCLTACGGGGEPTVTTTVAGGDTEPDQQPDRPKYDEIVLNAETLANYTIIRVDETTDEEIEIAKSFKAALSEAVGIDVHLGNDFLMPEQQPKELEILIGETNREGSAEIYKDLKYNDFIVTRDATRIYIAGGNADSISEAAEYFVSLFKDGSFTVPGDFYYEKKAEYKIKDMKIGGVSISEYKIVYGATRNKTAAMFLYNAVGEATGCRMDLIPQSADKGEYEILVGPTNRGSKKVEEYYRYESEVQGNLLFLRGYDNYALDNAALALGRAIAESDGDVTLDEIAVEYSVPDKSEYVEDIDKLYMRWIAEWDPDPKMLDFELKREALLMVSDRLLTCAHRADAEFYPENSLEGIISFYKMGGDVVEIDVQATKDGVLILLHDETLTRTTNIGEFAGKTIDGITFPTSAYARDWTYEQISYLSLREGYGGSKALVTPFKVPTLAEALKVCKNRMFVLPDKAQAANGGQWRYADIDGVQDNNKDYFLYDAMVEADNYNSILLSYGYLTPSEGVKVQKWLYEKTGVVAYMMIRENSSPKSTYKYLMANAMPGSFAIQVNGRFDPDSYVSRYGSDYEYLKDKILMLGWTISDGTAYPDSNDGKTYWDQMYDLGYRMIMTNKYMKLVKYAATKYDFAE